MSRVCIVCNPLAKPFQKTALTIALVTPEYLTEGKFHGGLANYVQRAAVTLVQLGHSVHVITSSVKQDSLVLDGVHVHRIPVWDDVDWVCKGKIFTAFNRCTKWRYHMAACFLHQSYCLYKAVKRLHKQWQFDIVQYPQLGGIAALRMRRVPAVVRLSSLASLWNAHGGFGESKRSMRQQEFLERLSLWRADAIFGPSRQIADYVQREIRRDINIIESPFVPDIDQLDDTIYNQLFSKKRYLLFFGSIGHIKGVGTISQIIYELLNRHSNLYFGFIGKRLHGQNGGDLMEQVWQCAKEHRNRIIWHDAVCHPQLYPVIKKAHTVVLPSRIDNFPNACIEAMAHKKVVIGTKGNGFEQLIEHGNSGLLCAPDNPIDLLRTIDLALLLSEAERQSIGANAAKRITDLYPEKVGKQLVGLYEVTIKKTHYHNSMFPI